MALKALLPYTPPDSDTAGAINDPEGGYLPAPFFVKKSAPVDHADFDQPAAI